MKIQPQMIENETRQGLRKLFRSGGLKFFIYASCNYVIFAECKCTFISLSLALSQQKREGAEAPPPKSMGSTVPARGYIPVFIQNQSTTFVTNSRFLSL